MADRRALELTIPEYFIHRDNKWCCLLCDGPDHLNGRELRHAVAHERTTLHQRNIKIYLDRKDTADRQEPGNPISGDSTSTTFLQRLYQYARPTSPPLPPFSVENYSTTPPLSPARNENCSALDHFDQAVIPQDWHLSPAPGTNLSEGDQVSQVSGTHPDFPTPVGRRRANKKDFSDLWFPWIDRIEASLHVADSLPRNVFSDLEIEIQLWLLGVNGVKNVPSLEQVKGTRDRLQTAYGILPKKCLGSHGHTYYLNPIGEILVQEFSNMLVRPHLHLYPEEGNSFLKHPWQGSKWLHRMDPNLVTPMIRIGQQDFYLMEPAMLRDGSVCIPTRWFTRKGEPKDRFFGRAYRMVVEISEHGQEVWTVLKYDTITFLQKDLVLSYPRLELMYPIHKLPPPNFISGFRDVPDGPKHIWDIDSYSLPNRWRIKANGKFCYNVMIWLYCDDTSGNRSKKWNEHYSYLFTLANLERAESQRDYNIHFLTTSNIAHPLEMLEGIADDLEYVSPFRLVG